MEQRREGNGPLTPLARLIGQMASRPAGERGQQSQGIATVTPSLWQRLDMERIARRLIQTARVATAEHALLRAQEAVRKRDQVRAVEAIAGPGDRPATA